MAQYSITPKGTLVGRSVGLDRVFSHPLFKVISVMLWLSGLAGIMLVLQALTGISNPDPTTATFTQISGKPEEGGLDHHMLGLGLIALGIFSAYLPLRSFYKEKVRYPRDHSLQEMKDRSQKGEIVNLFEVFSFDAAKATQSLFSRSGNFTSKELALEIIKSPGCDFILLRLGISREVAFNVINQETSETPIAQVIEMALDVALVEQHHQIEIGDIFVALCQIDPALAKLIADLKLELRDIGNIVYWHTKMIRQHLRGRRFLDPERFQFNGGIGRDWAYAYTPLVQRFGRDLTEAASMYMYNLEVVGREKEIGEMKEALLRQKGGNVVLVGEAGIGKRTTVLGLAKRVATGAIEAQLAYRHIMEIDTGALLSGYQNLGEAAERLNQILSEIAQAGNVIIFIENIQDILSDGGAGKINAAEVLLPYLDSADIHVIGTTDVASYNQYIRPNTALNQRFTRVTIEETNEKDLVRILEDVVPSIESKTGSLITYEAIKETIKAGNKYILDIPNPEKSINLLDGASAHAVSQRGKTIILPKDVMEYVAMKYEVPSTDASEDEKKKLLQLEEKMQHDVIGQQPAVAAIAGALRRARAGVTDSKKPIGSFLFLGPTGVGKTETAKALAKHYFGGSDKMIRFDMSEFQNKEDIYRFIGSNIGGEEIQGVLTTAIREHPFSLLLFDEIEKAHRDILDLFLQVLDEGHLTDGMGRKVSFSNSIIICTSNAGANLIRESISNGLAYDKTKTMLTEYLQGENVYRPEFINRFTQVVAFSPLSMQSIVQVANLMIGRLIETVKKNRGVKLTVTSDAIIALAQMGYDPTMGARPMARVIQEKVENLLAEKILAGELAQDDSFTITKEMVV